VKAEQHPTPRCSVPGNERCRERRRVGRLELSLFRGRNRLPVGARLRPPTVLRPGILTIVDWGAVVAKQRNLTAVAGAIAFDGGWQRLRRGRDAVGDRRGDFQSLDGYLLPIVAPDGRMLHRSQASGVWVSA